MRIDMEGHDGPSSADRTFGGHLIGAAGEHFFGWLEEEANSASVPDVRPRHGQAQRDGGVSVVTTCMHHSGCLGREWEADRLGDGQGVEVRPKHDEGAFGADVDREPGFGCPEARPEPGCGEAACEQVCGDVLLFGAFGMSMHGTANVHHGGKDARNHVGGVEHEPQRVLADPAPNQVGRPPGSSLSPVAESRRTRTSNFGSSRRESHDATAFYERFDPPIIGKDRDIDWTKALNAIHLGDARHMVEVPSNSVALVVTSPPYFAGKEYEEDMGKGHVPASYQAYLHDLEEVFAECVRTLEPGGRLAVNVANLGRRPYRSLSGDVIGIFERLGLLLRGEVVWVKARGASGSTAWGTFQRPANPVLRDLSERIVLASKGRFDRAVSMREREEQNRPHVSDIWRDEFMEATTDIWEIPSESATRVNHPAPFPVELPRRLIELFTYRGDLVLDPFMGSGSTAVAAVQSGRHYVGYEIDADYHARAVERVTASGIESTAGPRAPAAPGEGTATDVAVQQGRAIRDVAAAILDDAGFRDIREGVRVGPGIDVTFEAKDQSGTAWLFDLSGAFTASAPGLVRTEVLWKAVGRAAVIDRHRAGRKLVLLTSHRPTERSPGARILAEMVGPDRPIFDVVELLDDEGAARLAAYADS